MPYGSKIRVNSFTCESLLFYMRQELSALVNSLGFTQGKSLTISRNQTFLNSPGAASTRGLYRRALCLVDVALMAADLERTSSTIARLDGVPC